MSETLLNLIIASLAYGGVIVCAGIGIGWLVDIGRLSIEKALDKVVDTEKRVFIINKVTFLGVIHHELAHAIIFFLTGAKVVKMQLFTLNSRSGHLGQVQVIHRGSWLLRNIQRTLGAVAPVFLGIANVAMILSIVRNYDLYGWLDTFLYYLALSIFIHMDLSKEDVKVALKGLPITYGVLVIIIFIIKLVQGYLLA